jgi:hypothetical protein
VTVEVVKAGACACGVEDSQATDVVQVLKVVALAKFVQRMVDGRTAGGDHIKLVVDLRVTVRHRGIMSGLL